MQRTSSSSGNSWRALANLSFSLCAGITSTSEGIVLCNLACQTCISALMQLRCLSIHVARDGDVGKHNRASSVSDQQGWMLFALLCAFLPLLHAAAAVKTESASLHSRALLHACSSISQINTCSDVAASFKAALSMSRVLRSSSKSSLIMSSMRI